MHLNQSDRCYFFVSIYITLYTYNKYGCSSVHSISICYIMCQKKIKSQGMFVTIILFIHRYLFKEFYYFIEILHIWKPKVKFVFKRFTINKLYPTLTS